MLEYMCIIHNVLIVRLWGNDAVNSVQWPTAVELPGQFPVKTVNLLLNGKVGILCAKTEALGQPYWPWCWQ